MPRVDRIWPGLLFLCGALTGCSGWVIPIPVPHTGAPAKESRTNLDAQTPDTLTAGQTTRTQVLLMLGEPDGRGPADGWFTYGSVTQRPGIHWVGPTYIGDWDVSRRLLVRFDPAGIVATVEYSTRDCTDAKHNCLEPSGADLLTVGEDRVMAAGEPVARYRHNYLEWWSSYRCELKARHDGGNGGYGDDLVVTHDAIFWLDRRDQRDAPLRWRMLPLQEIARVLPLQDDGAFEWIVLQRRDGSCFFFHVEMLADQTGFVRAQTLSWMIQSELSGPRPPQVAPSEATH